MEYFEYITIENERWDTLAYRWYGDALLFTHLVRLNPHIPIQPVLASGTLVFVPRLNLDQRTDAAKLPPWKRSA
jgi:hypothetical protein